jgi:hypothetical protein
MSPSKLARSVADARKMLAHSDKDVTAKHVATLPAGMRQVTLYEVVHNGCSIHLGTEERPAREFAEAFNELRPDDPATLVERPAVIATVGLEGGAV